MTSRDKSSGRPTVVPPVPAEELARKPEARRTPGGMAAVGDSARKEQRTLTDEVALERARVQSMDATTTPVPDPKGAPAATPEEEIRELEAKLGSLARVPVLVVRPTDLRDLALDHRAGFLLSHIDGISSLETILDVSGMPRLDALRILAELFSKNVVSTSR